MREPSWCPCHHFDVSEVFLYGTGVFRYQFFLFIATTLPYTLVITLSNIAPNESVLKFVKPVNQSIGLYWVVLRMLQLSISRRHEAYDVAPSLSHVTRRSHDHSTASDNTKSPTSNGFTSNRITGTNFTITRQGLQLVQLQLRVCSWELERKFSHANLSIVTWPIELAIT